MGIHIRPARIEDREAIAAFTSDTFEWGDYVPDRFEHWVGDDGCTLVAVEGGEPIAIGRAAMLSPTEAWLQGARVHPDHRRRGIATALGGELLDWARARGAEVARLAIEDWNRAARLQVERAGLRRVAGFVHTTRGVGASAPVLEGNGGRRATSRLTLQRASALEAEPAFMAWSTSPLNRAARGLFAVSWTWRRLTLDDLHAAGAGGALWAGGGAWAIAAPEDEAFEVAWCDVPADRARPLLRALLDVATDEGASRVRAIVPAVDAITAALDRLGYERSGVGVFAIGL